MKFRLTIIICTLPIGLFSQYGWIWEELPLMPEAISNNAVSHGTVAGESYVFSFSGIDTTKTNEGISLTSMRYGMDSELWEYIPSLPDTLGKIATAASTVNNSIYIIGGYHVFDGAPFELSSDKVHRFDPQSNSFLSDGAALPFPIDDQVQAVWRDSLIFVVTGWSNNQNVQHVQIYDPALDEWQIGTSVPNGSVYEAFGASGTIIGDTIYYFGGAVGFNFNSSGRLRKGVIDPEDPTQISWSTLGFSPNDRGYRCAALNIEEVAFWIGGSDITYNYDGIAYNGSGGVPPLNRILGYDPSSEQWADQNWQPFGIMDLRGIAQVGANEFVICGGMEEGQSVTDRAFLLTYTGPSSISNSETFGFKLCPNPIQLNKSFEIHSTRPFTRTMEVIDGRGALIGSLTLKPGINIYRPIECKIDARGSYFLIDDSGHSSRLIVN